MSSFGRQQGDLKRLQATFSPEHMIPERRCMLKPNNDHLMEVVYTVEETASLLKVSKKTVYRLVARDLPKATNALRHLRITRRSLEEFLARTSGEEA